MQDSKVHWTLHAVVEDDAAMARQFAKIIGEPINFEMLYVGKWKQNLLLADRYSDGRIFIAGDAAHLVIPTGGLGMNTGVGDAVDLAWKLAAALEGWAGPNMLNSYEVERRQVGDRNIGASRYASSGRRKWRGQWKPGFDDATAHGAKLRENLAAVADVEQRKTNEMIGAELGYRYTNSQVIWDEPGGPEQLFRTYDPTAWTGVRFPHAWMSDGKSIHDLIGAGYSLVCFGEDEPVDHIEAAFHSRGIPLEIKKLSDNRLRELYGRSYFLLRPDLHIAWRGHDLNIDADVLAGIVSGHLCPATAR